MVRDIPESTFGARLIGFWRSTLKLAKQDWGAGSRELGLYQLERAGCYDGLDICDCACLEDVFRQV